MGGQVARIVRKIAGAQGRGRPRAGALVTLALAAGLFLTPPPGVGRGQDCGSDGAVAAPGWVDACAPAPLASLLQADLGGLWVIVPPVEVLVSGVERGPVFRSLVRDGEPVQASPAEGGGQSALELAQHAVEPGESLSSISERFKIDVATLVQANDVKPDAALAAGTRLVVPPVIGVLHTVQAGESVGALAERYGVDLGRVAEVNGLEPPYTITVGQRLLLPDGKLPAAPAPVEALAGSAGPEPAEAADDGPTLASAVGAGPAAAMPLPRPPGASPQRAAFILGAAEAARESQARTGVPASVTIAQAILESDWGQSKLSAEHHNYFGIKAREREGSAGVVWMETWEVRNGRDVTEQEPFRAYARAADSFIDHGLFFHQNRRYATALAAAEDPRQFAREINQAGYATDPNYSNKLITLMDRYDLYAYDLR